MNSPLPDTTAYAEIERELEEGENILWVGQPSASEFWRRALIGWESKIAVTGIALIWLGAVFWIRNLYWLRGEEPKASFYLILVVGVALLIYALACWWEVVSAKRRAQNTIYALTSRRALIKYSGYEARSLPAARICPQIRQIKMPPNFGDLILAYPIPMTAEETERLLELLREGAWSDEFCFVSIENPREVERIIREQLLQK